MSSNTNTIDRNPSGHNYCRNPSGDAMDTIWCYTTDPDKRWDFCYTKNEERNKDKDLVGVMTLSENKDWNWWSTFNFTHVD